MPETSPTNQNYYYGVGRRKQAVATVRLYSGKGKSLINDKPLDDYLNNDTLQRVVAEPQTLLGHNNDTYVVIRVSGGGTRAQADAVRLGIARALLTMSEDFRPSLRKAGLLTRDAREKERKKYGLKKARKAPQFSKR